MVCEHCRQIIEPIIPMSNGGAMRVDPADYYALVLHVWYRVRRGNAYYAEANINGRPVHAHRLIMSPADGFVVDHINGDGLDNRRENLRICLQGQNVINSVGRRGTSAFKGVSSRGGKWRARIMVGGREIPLGRFADEESAARAYDRAAVEHFGQFAKLNFGPAPAADEAKAA